jgi:hypothetical protein
MGQGSGDNDYLWGIKFKNNYDVPVTFKYKLSIGEKITSKYGGNEASLKRKGDQNDTWIDGNDKTTAKLYHTPSEEWYLYIWDVCFDGMRCGGADECFADCDKDKDYPKPNQPCGLSSSPSLNAPEINNEPKEMSGKQAGPKKEDDETPDIGETSNWKRDDETVEVNMGKIGEGIYWKRKKDKQYSFFKKLPDGSYMFDAGKDLYSLKFVSATKVGFYKNNVLENYYTLDGEKEDDDGTSKVRSGIWEGIGKVKITATKEGLVYHTISNLDDGSPFFKRVSATEYRRDDADGIHFCTLKLKEDEKLHYTCSDKPGSYVGMGELSFVSADEETKPTDETNGDDKYNFKGTTVWQHPRNESYKIVSAQINNGLIELVELGYPIINIHIGKLPYKRVAPDTYQESWDKYKIDSLSNDFLKFISSDRLVRARYLKTWVDTGYYKKGKRGKEEFIVTGKKDTFYYNYDTLTLVATRTIESLPKAISQIVTPADVTGTWRPESKWLVSIESFKVRITPLGEDMLCNFGSGNSEKTTYTYKKTSVNTYEYKTDNGNGAIGRLVFLSPTRICLSYVYKNYVSIGYYNKGAATIVKKVEKPVIENKPVPVTENKTAALSEGLSDEWYGEGNLNPPRKLKTTSNGLMMYFSELSNGGVNYSGTGYLFNKTGENEYQRNVESSPGVTVTENLTFYNKYTIRIASKVNKTGYSSGGDQYFHNKALISNPTKLIEWVNNNPTKQWDVLNLVTTDVGIYNFSNPFEKVMRFFRKTTTANAFVDDSGNYKTYLKLNGTNSITLEFCGANGQVNQIENYVRKAP